MRKTLMLAALVAAPASAQNSTTSCFRVGNTVQCNTNTQPGIQAAPPVDFSGFARQQQETQRQMQENTMRAIQAAQQARQQREQAQYAAAQAEIAADRARFSADLRRDVSAMLAEGKCQEAIAVALKYSDIELANQAKQFCAKP